MRKIIDQYTDLPISAARKHQLRNPEKTLKRMLKYRKRKVAKIRYINRKSRNKNSNKPICAKCFHQLRWLSTCQCRCHKEVKKMYERQVSTQ